MVTRLCGVTLTWAKGPADNTSSSCRISKSPLTQTGVVNQSVLFPYSARLSPCEEISTPILHWTMPCVPRYSERNPPPARFKSIHRKGFDAASSRVTPQPVARNICVPKLCSIVAPYCPWSVASPQCCFLAIKRVPRGSVLALAKLIMLGLSANGEL